MMQKHNKHQSVLGMVLRFLIPVTVTVGLCWLMFKHLDFNEMLQIIKTKCDFSWILLGLALSVISMIARALRWRIQLIALGITVPRHVLVYSIFGTYAINLVFPRLGEVWRSGYIAHRQEAPFATVFGSMVAERLSDTFAVLLFLIAAFILSSGTLLQYMHNNEESYKGILSIVESPLLWGAIVACVLAFIMFMRRKAAPGSKLAKLQGFFKGLWTGFAIIVRMKGKLRWLVYTCVLWGCYFMQLYLAFFAFPFTADVVARYGITAVIIVYAISSVAMGVPSNGGIGPWQFAVIFSLGFYGVDTTDAGAFANLQMGCQTALTILLGFYTFIAIMLDKKRIKTTYTKR